MDRFWEKLTDSLADSTSQLAARFGNDNTWDELIAMAVERLDDRLDLDEAFASGMPSITAQNGQSQPGTGDPSTDPNAQGPQGPGNAPGPVEGDSNMGPRGPAPSRVMDPNRPEQG
jgi:hypothetical protein